MINVARRLVRLLGSAARDLLPLVVVVIVFQTFVIGQPFPDLVDVLSGLGFVVVGLALFIRGLEMGLFPLGEAMASAFVRRGNVFALLAFAFTLGFGTTIAEPALIAIADEAARASAEAALVAQSDMAAEALSLRLIVALSVGTAIVIGVLRILRGWPITSLIIGGYLLVVALTPLAPPAIVAVAYDSGGVTTSTVTVPLVTALGVGLAQVIRGRNPVVDGFGLIAFASLMPVVFVLLFGIFSRL